MLLYIFLIIINVQYTQHICTISLISQLSRISERTLFVLEWWKYIWQQQRYFAWQIVFVWLVWISFYLFIYIVHEVRWINHRHIHINYNNFKLFEENEHRESRPESHSQIFHFIYPHRRLPRHAWPCVKDINNPKMIIRDGKRHWVNTTSCFYIVLYIKKKKREREREKKREHEGEGNRDNDDDDTSYLLKPSSICDHLKRIHESEILSHALITTTIINFFFL